MLIDATVRLRNFLFHDRDLVRVSENDGAFTRELCGRYPDVAAIVAHERTARAFLRDDDRG